MANSSFSAWLVWSIMLASANTKELGWLTLMTTLIMNHLQWGTLLQPINGTYCRIISTTNGHIDMWSSPSSLVLTRATLALPLLIANWVEVCFVVLLVMLYSVLRAASWANTWSYWMRSAGSVQSPALLLERSFWCVEVQHVSNSLFLL